jgi:hypothetical protein
MTLTNTVTALDATFKLLREAAGDLLVSVGDKPSNADNLLFDLLEDLATDLLGWIEEALNATAEAEQALEGVADTRRVRWALEVCQEKFDRIALRFWVDIVHEERSRQVKHLARRQGGAGWRHWAANVKTALHRCEGPLLNVHLALIACWRTFAEGTALALTG